jgi:nucleotide-binding universal stress UspA family protein
MFDRIAVPLDGSDIAARAIGPGRRLAKVHDARLVLVTVATPATGGTARAHDILAAGCVAAGHDDVDTLVIDADDAAGALAEFDADHPATLMCMTTRGTRRAATKAARRCRARSRARLTPRSGTRGASLSL